MGTSALPAVTLLELSRQGLRESALATVPARRYAAAHLAALRAAAAVLACRARPVGSLRQPGVSRLQGPTSAWVLLAGVAPELAEWADFFAQSARKRAAAEAGLPVVSPREADDLLRDAQAFLHLADEAVELAHPQSPIPTRVRDPAQGPAAQALPAWADAP